MTSFTWRPRLRNLGGYQEHGENQRPGVLKTSSVGAGGPAEAAQAAAGPPPAALHISVTLKRIAIQMVLQIASQKIPARRPGLY